MLVVGLLAGCLPADPVCEDAPLSTTCPRIRGAWRIEASKSRSLCEAALFDEPLVFANTGPSLTITIKELVATGLLSESGAFEAPRGCESTWQFTATR